MPIKCPCCPEEMHEEKDYPGAYFCLWCGTLQLWIYPEVPVNGQ